MAHQTVVVIDVNLSLFKNGLLSFDQMIEE